MNIDLVRHLNEVAHALSSWVETLEYFTENANASWPREYGTREEFIQHVGNMIGGYSMEFDRAYNAIPEWMDK